jgi:hypothetical protein
MTKRICVNRFGLVALILSLFASTAAFAGAGPSQVIVTNTPAQAVPMVGLITDSDTPARKPFQAEWKMTQPVGSGSGPTITTVPANQRLVIEHVSAYCSGPLVLSFQESGPASHYQWLPASLASGNFIPAASPARFYVDPGADLNVNTVNNGNAAVTCLMTVSGYFVNLP